MNQRHGWKLDAKDERKRLFAINALDMADPFDGLCRMSISSGNQF